jgi:hypothetical protein
MLRFLTQELRNRHGCTVTLLKNLDWTVRAKGKASSS